MQDCLVVVVVKFRKKPVTVDALRVPISADDTMGWHALSIFLGRNVGPDPPAIVTMEGIMQAEPGDWIIRGVKGECYPCKPDIFEATYEAVND